MGASATGVQLAAEIRRSGRPVTLSVGEHVRLPRTYRGRDVLWWMDASGVWDQRYDEVDDLDPGPAAALAAAGRHARAGDARPQRAHRARASSWSAAWAAVRDGRALFSGGLRNVFSLADLKLERLLDTFDEWARTSGRDGELDRARALRADPRARRRRGCSSTCAAARSATIVWATGFRPDYRLARRAGASTRRASSGTTAASSDSPGLYALGLPVLRRRKSTFIYGIEDDAREVIDHLAGYLSATSQAGG